MDDHGVTSISTPIDLSRLERAARASGEASGRVRAQAGAIYVVAALASIAVAKTLGVTTSLSGASIGCLIAGFVLALVVAGHHAGTRRASTLWAVALTAFAGACLYLLSTDRLPQRPYGDGALFSQFVAEGRVIPRWLVGSAAATTAHAAVWELPPVRSRLPEPLQSPSAFLGVLGTVTMVGGTWGLFRRWPGRLSVLLPTLTPVWVLFASGYVEYYPLIAVAFVAALAWLFERPLEERGPYEIGALSAGLALLYVGFVPMAGLLLATWMLLRRVDALRALAAAVVIGMAAIAMCWPEGGASYFRTLYLVLNFGDANLPPQYAGQIAGPASFMFAADAVQSLSRVREIVSMLAWGGGWWALPLVVVAACRAVWTSPERSRRGRVWLGAALVVSQLYYIVFMVPRLGPVGDVDLFFTTYLTLAFMAGLLLDSARTSATSAWTACALSCVLATLAVTAPWLVWFGLPPLP